MKYEISIKKQKIYDWFAVLVEEYYKKLIG